jgi:flagellar hook protein FlgE
MFALHTGASGLNTYGEAMTVVGANIANVNTLGYKSNRVNFQDLLATSLSGVRGRIGKGVKMGSVQADFTQGNLTPSTMITDLAVDGQGFFTVRDPIGRTYYTRAGNFQFDKEGFLVNPEGAYLQVRDIDEETGETSGFPHATKLIGLNAPPKATGDGTGRSGVKVSANLNAEAEIPAVPFDPTNVQADMYNFSTTVTVHDQNGGEHVLNVVFRKIQDRPPQIDPATGQEIPGSGSRNQWNWYAVSDASEFGGTPGVLVSTSGGFLRFTDNGRMLEATNGRFVQPAPGQVGPDGQLIPPGPPQLIEAPLQGTTPIPQATLPFADIPLVVGLDFGEGSNPDDPADQRTGLDGITQFAAESKVSKIESDGYKAGSLEDIEITRDGVIVGHFDNGTNRSLSKIMLTRFAANESLLRRGEGLFEESLASGRAIQGNANDGTFGSIRSQNLERSNVDLAKEFVKMIETQRAFQANAKSITTSDEMLADLVAMKR